MIDIREHGIDTGGFYKFFGDGSDGDLNTTGDVQIDSTLDGSIVIKQYQSVTINSGHTLMLSNPCQGLIILCKGNFVLDGVIDMRDKGSALDIFTGQLPLILLPNIENFQWAKFGDGGNGGNGGYFNDAGAQPAYNYGLGMKGTIFTAGRGGGGGGGKGRGGSSAAGYLPGNGGSINHLNNTMFGTGADGVSIVDGAIWGIAGANGAGGSGSAYSGNASYYATSGDGGDAKISGGGGSGGTTAFNLNKAGYTASPGKYGSALLIVVVKGNVTINGQILAQGSAGGAGGYGSGYNSYSASGGGGGGGAGGGAINILHKGTYINNGILDVSGGSGGAGGALYGNTQYGEAGYSGASGTIGEVKITKI